MHTLRSKITLLNILPITVAMLVTTAIGVITIADFGHESSEQSLSLLCETGKNNLNYYFKSVEQSENTLAQLIDSDLGSIEDDFNAKFEKHVERIDETFRQFALNTNGAFTYYYRMDIPITNATGQAGFWYVKEGNDFVFHDVTPITYEEGKCVWFNIPKNTKESKWLMPYETDNLGAYVLSYNTPIYKSGIKDDDHFIGVIGIEISYSTLGEQIKNIKALNTGYAFIVENQNGTIISHPQIDLLSTPVEQRPQTPSEFAGGLHYKDGEKGLHIVYSYEGATKHCFAMPLSNDMSIVVTAPISEVNNVWLKVVIQVVIAAILFVIISIVSTFIFSKYITKPLKELTRAAEEINNGNYDVKLNYKGNDEIGLLTNTVNRLVENLSGYINDLNSLAYADVLTSVRNIRAFEIATNELQKNIDSQREIKFAIAIFDCDNLKEINDEYGHDKGDVYLRNSCNLICRIFKRSAVFRIGGDEFAIILINDDYKNRTNLRNSFVKKSAEICSFAKEPWEQISVSVGIAAYDPSIDKTVKDVMVRADQAMYANKHERKEKKK